MSVEIITKEDLQIFRIQLLDDFKRLLANAKKSDNEPSEWIKGKEAQRILKVSPGTLQGLRISGKLNPAKVSGTWRYRLAEVNALFNNK